MISWMQKHKKYLVITIWISTIAFVGAGFVGWGAYKYGSASNAVAEVGNEKITLKEFQQRYANVYNYYNKMLQGKLDQEQAKKMGLDKMVLNELIQEALLENYAHDLGLLVTDEEVAQKIASMKVFWQNGSFDKNLYNKLLQQNHIKPKDFEQSIRKEILLQKLNHSLSYSKPLQLEFDMMASALFMGDKIKYAIMTDDEINATVSQKELKKYYEEHKNRYKTVPKYDLSLIEIPIKHFHVSENELKDYYKQHKLKYKDDKGKILSFDKAKEQVMRDLDIKKSKKEALKKYIQFKKGKLQAQKHRIVALNDTTFPSLLMQKIARASQNSVLKPVFIKDRFVIVKINKKIPSLPMSFEKAVFEVKKDLLQQKRYQLLLEKAKKMVKNFQGTITDGYITKEDFDKLNKLSPQEAQQFLQKLFLSQSVRGFVALGNKKVVLYQILDQKLQLIPKIRKNKALISNNSVKLKNTIQNDNLIKKLQSMYEIKVYKGI
ncbi:MULTISPECIES: peptidylprolyl isomerase [unclassified Nitratiruptor]|uniref:peptidylprolyl isomerase n=1 Tax=unclassified Nitratiruptor TaxID=2624044 RepID=UPI0019152621|nr:MULTISPECIES: peptidylprolyl isomerase [unclassified Nitratiruptor]BCD60253.1 peptidyl-prolyl cis-trans isomerase D [Nitratiruptor sp. YY08-10]BCD64258.1 peptidyl-prolyl cis-trans isomerase D [Nitratiruptor sp. YY08-14]